VHVDRKLNLAQSGTACAWNNCANLMFLGAEAHQLAPVPCVLADTESDFECNHMLCRQQLEPTASSPPNVSSVAGNRSARTYAGVLASRSMYKTLSDGNRLLRRPTKAPLPICRSDRLCCWVSLQPLSPLAACLKTRMSAEPDGF
jgi:hypothetical protein